MSQPGFNFFGHVSGNFGLGITARATLAWLLEQRQLVCLRDVSTNDERTGQNRRYQAMLSQPWQGLPFDVNFFHLNPPELAYHMGVDWWAFPIDRRLNVALPFWELPSLPTLWRDVLAAMDLVLAPTRFIGSVLQDNAPEIRWLYFPVGVQLPEAAPATRSRFGIPDGALTFLCAFDMASDIERKNPWGAIRAFQAAFTGQESVRLVIKVSHAQLLPSLGMLMEKLRRVVQQDPRLILIDEHLTQADLFSLFASCDVLASLHRSEGLGQILMEMMSLGKPVITTAWSGNMDFCTVENSCLVDYDMVPVQATHHVYQHEAARSDVRWAEPRVATAASWMRRLYLELELRQRLGRQAAHDLQVHNRWARVGSLEKMREILGSPDVRAQHQSRARGLLAQRVRGLLGTLRLSPRRFLRTLGAVAAGPRISQNR